jgi:NTE family protein
MRTFADLKRANGPLVIVNGTDITIGARFSFTQDQFDAICGDLSKVTLGRRWPLRRRCRRCSRRYPSRTAAGPAAGRRRPGRPPPRPRAAGPRPRGGPLLRARALQSYADPSRPYVHVFDGGPLREPRPRRADPAFELLKVDADETVLPALAGRARSW